MRRMLARYQGGELEKVEVPMKHCLLVFREVNVEEVVLCGG